MRLLFIILFFLSKNISAQDLEKQILDELTSIDKENELKIQQVEPEMLENLDIDQAELKEETLSENSFYENYEFMLIPKNSVIFSLDKKLAYLIPKNIFSKIKRSKGNSDYSLVLDKRNQHAALIRNQDLYTIKDVIDINVHPQNYQTYEPQKETKIDSKINLMNSVNFYLERWNWDFLSETYTSDDIDGTIYRYEYSLHLDWSKPYTFGLAASFSSGGVTQDNQPIATTRGFLVGPIIMYDLLNNSSLKLSLRGSAHKSFFYQIVEEDDNGGEIDLNLNTLEAAMIINLKTRIGILGFGFQYRKNWIQFKSENNNSKIDPEKTPSTSWGPFIGYQWDMSL